MPYCFLFIVWLDYTRKLPRMVFFGDIIGSQDVGLQSNNSLPERLYHGCLYFIIAADEITMCYFFNHIKYCNEQNLPLHGL